MALYWDLYEVMCDVVMNEGVVFKDKHECASDFAQQYI